MLRPSALACDHAAKASSQEPWKGRAGVVAFNNIGLQRPADPRVLRPALEVNGESALRCETPGPPRTDSKRKGRTVRRATLTVRHCSPMTSSSTTCLRRLSPSDSAVATLEPGCRMLKFLLSSRLGSCAGSGSALSSWHNFSEHCRSSRSYSTQQHLSSALHRSRCQSSRPHDSFALQPTAASSSGVYSAACHCLKAGS